VVTRLKALRRGLDAKAMEIYVDADACPVKNEVVRVATRHGLIVHMVSNSFMRLDNSPLVKRVVVSDGLDAADDWIADRVTDRDIAVTSDIPLASRCLENGAKVIRPNGKEFTDDNIGMSLAMRSLMSDLRDSGEVSGHNPSFTKRDRSTFLQALEQAVQDLKRAG